MHGHEIARPDPTCRRLSPARQQLLRVMQRVHYGRIENLRVLGGEPILDPPPRTVRTFKTSGRNTPNPQVAFRDFALRESVVEFFRHLDSIRDGTIAVIKIIDGLPDSFEIEDANGS